MIPRFRYYDDILNRYVYSEEFDIENINERLGAFFYKATYSNYDIDQSLDFYDRNNVELYENDVVSVVEEYCPETEEEYMLLPVRQEGSGVILPCREIRKDLVERKYAHCWLKNEVFGYEGEELVNVKDTIVIGSKYTHPDIMKEIK